MKKILVIAVIALALTPSAASSKTDCLLTFFTEGIPEMTVNDPVNFELDVCCGTPPYRFEVVEGALPAGLHLNQNGKLTGKPTEVTDTTVFVRLTDAAGCSLTQAFAVRVNPEP